MRSNNINCGNPNYNSPYYNGPCPTVGGEYNGNGNGNGSGNDDDRNCRRHDDDRDECRRRRRRRGYDRENIQGYFFTPSPLTVAAGAAIPFLPGCTCYGGGMDTAGGGMVEIEEEGVYYAAYTVMAPAGTALETTLTPCLNGLPLLAGVVDTADAAEPVSGQVIFRADEDDMFALTTAAAISIAAAPMPVISMNILRIGD